MCMCMCSIDGDGDEDVAIIDASYGTVYWGENAGTNPSSWLIRSAYSMSPTAYGRAIVGAE
jgi:hypothetical protein